MIESLYLAITKEGKQLGLFLTSEQAFAKFEDTNTCEIWNLNKKTGQFHPTNASIGRLELIPKKDDEIYQKIKENN